MSIPRKILNLLFKLEKNRALRELNTIMLSAAGLQAIPLEQLKGDIARAGFPVERTLALDAENRRLFFTDQSGGFMFAEYGQPEEAFTLKRIGSQSEIAKEYDVVDPDDEPRMDFKTTHYEEDYTEEDPGMIPSGTPGVKPEDEDQRDFGDEKLDVLGKALAKVRAVTKQSRTGLGLADDEMVEKQPPREGLVPQTGDPEHPGRWVKPQDAEPTGPMHGPSTATRGQRGSAARARRQGRERAEAERAVVPPESARERQPTMEEERPPAVAPSLHAERAAERAEERAEMEAMDAAEVADKRDLVAVAESRLGRAMAEQLGDILDHPRSDEIATMMDVGDLNRNAVEGIKEWLQSRPGDHEDLINEIDEALMGEDFNFAEDKASMSADPVERARRLRNSLQTGEDVAKRRTHKQRPGHGNWRRAQTRGGRNGA